VLDRRPILRSLALGESAIAELPDHALDVTRAVGVTRCPCPTTHSTIPDRRYCVGGARLPQATVVPPFAAEARTLTK
jgi:hypothetical protein